jgi:hypothetical protein
MDDIVEKLGAMGTGAGHQYLDVPRDDVQIMASFGEYGDEWWNGHGTESMPRRAVLCTCDLACHGDGVN